MIQIYWGSREPGLETPEEDRGGEGDRLMQLRLVGGK